MDAAQGSTSARGLELPDWNNGPGTSFGNLEDLSTLQPDSPRLASTDSPGTRGRKRDAEAAEQETFESLLAQLGRDEGAQLDGKRSSSKPSANAARNKASRERQRRERLNDCFTDLAKILEPGKASKTDKANIISDAIRIVTQLRGENSQLRQLNKFLEERVGQCEKARNDLLLQQALMQGQARTAPSSSHMQQAMYGGGLPGVVQGVAIGLPAMQVPERAGSAQPGADPPRPASAMQTHQQHMQLGQPFQGQWAQGQPPVPSQLQQQQHHQQEQGQPQQQLPHMHQARYQACPDQQPPAQGAPVQGQQQVPQLPQGAPQQPQGVAPSHTASSAPVHVMSEAQAFLLKQERPEGMNFGLSPGVLPGGMSSWLPPSTMDTSMDSIRRPPAA